MSNDEMIECPHCNAKVRVAYEDDGVACPNCGEWIAPDGDGSVELIAYETKERDWSKVGSLTGMPDGYERGVRAMVDAGLAFIEKNSSDDGYEDRLEKAMLAACHGCSGASFGCDRRAVRFITLYGWDAFVSAVNESKE